MKVLMFGWEFPPKIYGGLAVASYGITQGLSKKRIKSLSQILLTIVNRNQDRYPTHLFKRLLIFSRNV